MAGSGDDLESLVVTLPIRLVDGQIYYHHQAGKVEVEPLEVRSDVTNSEREVIVIDLESEDHDSDVDVMKHILNAQQQSLLTSENDENAELDTTSPFHLSLEEDETSDYEMATTVPNNRSIPDDPAKDEEVVVAEHGAEVPVVTTPLHCTAFDINQCVADIIGVVMDKQLTEKCSNKTTREGTATKITTLDSCLDSTATKQLARIQIPSISCSSSNERSSTSQTTTGLRQPQSDLSNMVVEESVLLDSSSLCDGGGGVVLPEDFAMGNEVVLSLEGSSESYNYMDSSELISNLLLHSCLPKNGGHISL